MEEDLNLATLWEAVADTVPGATALVHGETTRTWAQLEGRAARLAGAFEAAGVTAGSRVAIGCYNCPEYLETVFAACKASAAPVNLNYRYRAGELAHVMADAGASAVVFHSALSERVQEAVALLGRELLCVEVSDDVAAPARGDAPSPGAARYEDLVSGTPRAPRRGRSGDDELLLYTGGTTGLPRGVLWRHKTVFAMQAQQIVARGFAAPASAGELAKVVAALHDAGQAPAVLVASPLMHGTGIITSMSTFSLGGMVVLCRSRSLDADEICRLVGAHRVRLLTIVGDVFAKPVLAALDAAAAAGRPYDLSSLERITSIGLTWSAEVKEGLLRHADVTLVDTVAASEGAGFATAETRRGDPVETGRFRLGPSAKVLRADGSEVLPGSGEAGYLAATGPLPDGYVNDPEKTARTWWNLDGVRYVVPGDMATLEPDGTVVLLGRGSEVVNSGGEKVFVEEVEQVVAGHPDVVDVIVVGVPDERYGARVAAVVQLAPGTSASEHTIADYVGERLADHKRPRQVVFVEQVPRSPSGKADRSSARALVVSAGRTAVQAAGLASEADQASSAEPARAADQASSA